MLTFLTLSHPFPASMVAEAFMENVFKLHGLPTSIIGNRDVVLLGKVWQTFFKLKRSGITYVNNVSSSIEWSNGDGELVLGDLFEIYDFGLTCEMV